MEMPIAEAIMQSVRDSALETETWGRWRNISLENAGICGRYNFTLAVSIQTNGRIEWIGDTLIWFRLEYKSGEVEHYNLLVQG